MVSSSRRLKCPSTSVIIDHSKKKSSLLQEQVWQQANNVPVPLAFRMPCVVNLCTQEKHKR